MAYLVTKEDWRTFVLRAWADADSTLMDLAVGDFRPVLTQRFYVDPPGCEETLRR